MANDEPTGQGIELKSEEVKEILGHIPHWIIRWGTGMVFCVVLLIILGSWWYKYPDMVPAKVVVTTENPPSNAVARTNGKIMQLFVKDNEQVNSGQILALIENPGNTIDIFKLKAQIDTFRRNAGRRDGNYSYTFSENPELGEIQPYFAGFLKLYNDFNQFVELDYHHQKISSIEAEILKYKDYSKRLNNQSRILKQEENLAARQFKRDSTVFTQGVIPESEFEKSKASYLQKQYAYEQSRILLASNEIQLSKLSQEILDLELKQSEDFGKLRTTLDESVNKLFASIAEWEQKYVLKSTIDGIVSFTRIWSQNQDVREGDLVMSVIPVNPGKMIGKVNLPLSGAGKVKPGQWVNIKFANFPYLEYGIVKGTIRSISLVSSNDEYSVIVDLPEGLRTGYGTELSFNQEMQGTAEIITNDRRLIERIVLPVRAAFSRQKQLSGN